jgi:hypothetical protein
MSLQLEYLLDNCDDSTFDNALDYYAQLINDGLTTNGASELTIFKYFNALQC